MQVLDRIEPGGPKRQVNETGRDRDRSGIEKDRQLPVTEPPGRKERLDGRKNDRYLTAIHQQGEEDERVGDAYMRLETWNRHGNA
ncbi:MAG: hypothetical protein IPM25_13185 [Chloracidobacterium sp.]|nr:hypothetical protein [Chloracidobacterium sp.]